MGSAELEDRQAIVDQLDRLAKILDRRAWDRLAEVMTDDVDAYGFEGRDRVLEQSLRRHLGGCGPSQHLLGNYQVRVDGDTATSTTRIRVFHQGAGERAEKSFECFGWYHDTWARHAQGWLMTGRRMDTDIVVGDFDVLQPG